MKNNTNIVICLTVVFCLLSAFCGFPIAEAQEQTMTGKWVDPVTYFHLNKHGDNLSQNEMEAIMWEKERHITGMMIRVYNIAFVKDDPTKTSMPLMGSPSFQLYINSPASISAVSDMSGNSKIMGVYDLVANDVSFSFNPNSHTYSFSYIPAGTYVYDDPSKPLKSTETDEDFDYDEFKRLQEKAKTKEELARYNELLKRIENAPNHEHRKATEATDMGLCYSKKEGVWGYFLNCLHDPEGIPGYRDLNIYVHFKVEKVQLDGDETLLSEAQRNTLINQLDELTETLQEYVDVTGDHTGPVPSAIISTISTIGALLLANGVTSITGNISDIFGGGPSSPTPTPTPDPSSPYGDAIQPNTKRKEEDQPPQPEPEPEPEPELQPTPEELYWKHFVTEDAEGTLTMRDPATGQIMHYYQQENGEYLSDSGFTFDKSVLVENLRLRAENAGYFNQIAQKAEADVAEQRAQAARENAETQARGDVYRAQQEKEAQEEAKRQAYLQKLADKYGVDVNDVVQLRKTISDEKADAEREAELWKKTANILDKTTTALEVIDKASEITINIMGDCVPGGAAVKNAYTFAHSVAAAGGQAYADDKTGWNFTKELCKGAIDGGLGVLQNCAGDLASNVYTEGVMVVGTEGIRKGLEAMSDPKKTPDEILSAMGHGMTSKLNNFLIGKGVEKGLNTLGKSADQTLDPYNVSLEENTGFRFDTTLDALKYKSFMRGGYETGIGKFGKFKAIVSASGEISGMTNNFGMDNISNFVTDDAIPAVAAIPDDVKYYVDTLKEFSNKAAQYRNDRLSPSSGKH